MNKYDWKYILKKVLTFFIIFVLLSLINSCRVKAETYAPTIKVNGSVLNTNNYITLNSGNNTININYDGYWGDDPTYKWYVSVAFCMDNNGTSAYSTNTAVSDVQVFNTQYGCYYPNSSYTGGHVVILNYKQTGGGSYNNSNIIVYFNSSSSVALIDFQTDANSFIDSTKYASIGSLIEQKKIYEQNQTIINQNNQINSSIQNQTTTQHNDSVAEQNAINNNTGAINDLNDDITDDNVSGAESSVDSLLQNDAFNDSSGVNAIISLPLNFIQSLTSKSCRSLLLNIPYMNEVVQIPCMQNYIHTNAPTLYLIIKTLVNGFVIYRVLLDILSLVKSARNPDDDRIEVLDL